jgi:hypothetical protein
MIIWRLLSGRPASRLVGVRLARHQGGWLQVLWYVLCYIGDILVVSERPKRIMEGLEVKYVLKAGPMYLGAKVSKYWLEPGQGLVEPVLRGLC